MAGIDVKEKYELLTKDLPSEFRDLHPGKMPDLIKFNAEYLDRLSYQYVETTAKHTFLTWISNDADSHFPTGAQIEQETQANEESFRKIQEIKESNERLQEKHKEAIRELIHQTGLLRNDRDQEEALTNEVEDLERQLAEFEKLNKDIGILPENDDVFKKLSQYRSIENSQPISEDGSSQGNISLINSLDDLKELVQSISSDNNQLFTKVSQMQLAQKSKQKTLEKLNQELETLQEENSKIAEELSSLLKFREENHFDLIQLELEKKCQWYSQMIEIWTSQFIDNKIKGITVLDNDKFKVIFEDETDAQVFANDQIPLLRQQLNL